MNKITRISSLLALSIVLSILESFIPIFNFPGFKLGLANIVIVTVLYIYSFKDAIYISLVRILFLAILRTGFGISLYFSLSGALLSLIAMFLAKKTKLSIIGVSIIGSIFHIIGQIIVAIVLLNTNLFYYLPYLLIFSVISGTIIGKISNENIKFLNNKISQ